MKKSMKLAMIAALAALAASPLAAAEPAEGEAEDHAVLVSPNLIGPLYGYYSADLEFKIGENLALDVEPQYFNITAVPLFGTIFSAADIQLWYAGSAAGLVYYSKRVFKGGFAGGYLKGGAFSLGASGKDAVSGGYAGAGTKVGYRWTGSWASFAVGAKVEYTYSFVSIPSLSGTDSLFANAIKGFNLGILLSFAFAV
jgi:hypothetical protein